MSRSIHNTTAEKELMLMLEKKEKRRCPRYIPFRFEQTPIENNCAFITCEFHKEVIYIFAEEEVN